MAACGCGSPRGNGLRSVLLGAWMACLSLAVVMATDTSGIDMLLAKPNPVAKAELLLAERKVVKAMKNLQETSKFVEIVRATGIGGLAAGAASVFGSLCLWPSQSSSSGTVERAEGGTNVSSQRTSSKEKIAKALGAVGIVLLMGGAASTFASWVTGLIAGSDARRTLEKAIQRSAELKGLAPRSAGEDNEKADGDGATIRLQVIEPGETDLMVSWTKTR